MGMLTDAGRNRMTGASVALRVLARGAPGRPHRRRSARSAARSSSRSPRRGSAPRPELPADASPMHLGRRRGERQRQRDPPRGAAASRAVGAGAHRPRRVGARRAPHRVRRDRRARHDPPHDPRSRRSGVHAAGGGGPGARADPPAQLRRAAAGPVPDLGPRQGHPGPARPTRWAAAPAPAAAPGGVGHLRRASDRPPARCSSPPRSRPGSARCSPGSTASSPRPGRCSRTSRSWPARRASRRSSATRTPPRLPEGVEVHRRRRHRTRHHRGRGGRRVK